MAKYMGYYKTGRGIDVYVWAEYNDNNFDYYYVEREDHVRKTGGWKIVRKPYRETKEIIEVFDRRRKNREWLEEVLDKQIKFGPAMVSIKNCKEVYSIEFEDGEEKEYYIDFENRMIEEY